MGQIHQLGNETTSNSRMRSTADSPTLRRVAAARAHPGGATISVPAVAAWPLASVCEVNASQ